MRNKIRFGNNVLMRAEVQRSKTITTSHVRMVGTNVTIDSLFPKHDDFSERHIGPGNLEKHAMLETIGVDVS
jgi:hypothetical protein